MRSRLATAPLPAPHASAVPDGVLDDAASAAFRLAHFLHPDRETALRLTTAALAKLEVAVSAQDKRLYYRGRAGGASLKAGVFRRKVWMAEDQLLQRLVAIESEPFEKSGETRGAPPLAPEEGIVRFVKHLFRITARRNSFYVALGVGRVLHAFSTAETKSMYDTLAPDSAAEKADDYFRSRKAILMREIRERFGDALKDVRGAHGEERFETIDPAPYAALVAECLEWFTPWGTACPAALPLAGRPPNEAHESEMERMHVMLHPACLGRLARRLGLGDPSSRLQLPRLGFARDGTGGRRGGGAPPLTPAERQAIEEEIRAQAARRRKSAAGLLRCDVDGVTVGHLDPATDGRLSFRVGEDAERIEVFARSPEGDVPIASCLLARDAVSDRLQPARVSIRVEGGPRISMAIEPLELGELPGGAAVEIACREAFSSRFGRGFQRASDESRIGFVRLRALALVGVAAVAVALVLSTRTVRPPAMEGDVRPDASRTPAGGPTASPGTVSPDHPATPSVERGVEPTPDAVPLRGVRSIWVEAEGAPGLDALVRERLRGRFLSAAESREAADALLKLAGGGSGPAFGVHAELRAADGRTLWSGEVARYTGAPEEISRRIASDLERAAANARAARSRSRPAG